MLVFRKNQVQIMAVALVCVLLLVKVADVYAFGFHVQPSKLSFQIHPSKTALAKILIENTRLDETSQMKIEILHLIQDVNGASKFVDFNTANPSNADFGQSCAEWIVLNEPIFVLGPKEKKELQVRFKIPPTARGTYYAALAVSSIPKAEAGKISLAVRFAVTVEINIQGPTPRKQIEILDAGLSYHPLNGNTPANETFDISVSNSGQVTGKIGGKCFLFAHVGDKMRRVMALDIEETKCIPGAAFDFQIKLPRRLPSGDYRLDVAATIDGRHQSVLKREIQFVGDPSISTLSSDVDLRISPPFIEISGIAGARRKSFVILENTGESPLTIKTDVVQPPMLAAVSMGNITGTQISSHEWTSVKPVEFILKAGRKKRISITSVFPNEQSIQPAAFCKLDVRAYYEDGQLAGSTEVQVASINKKAIPTPKLEITRVALSHDKGLVFSVDATVGNHGDIHLICSCNVAVVNTVGTKKFMEINMSANNEPILPMGNHTYTGSLDLNQLQNGEYILRTKVSSSGRDTIKELFLTVSDDGEKRMAFVGK